MAGLYLHIPFCRDACHYCDFHFSIALSQSEPMLQAIGKEIKRRSGFLEGAPLSSVYFGGGTPSLLRIDQLEGLMQIIRDHLPIQAGAEITLEANPDDLEPGYLKSLKKLGIQRLSIGVQSFRGAALKMLNRRHNVPQALECIKNARIAGFENLNIDLMYGLPGQQPEDWSEDLSQAIKLRPEHLAAYHLGFEPGTVLDYRRRKGQLASIEEDLGFQLYLLAVDKLQAAGYEHYEISNFCQPGFHSRHNSAYWEARPYLGVGPSAHSFNGRIRCWNMSRNSSYIRGIMSGMQVWEEEILDETKRYNEQLMISLRTRKGLDLQKIGEDFGEKRTKDILDKVKPFIQSGNAEILNHHLSLSTEGLFIADHIISGLFAEEKS